MSSKHYLSVLAFGALGALAATAGVQAQVASPKLTITNTTPQSQVPLTGAVEIDANGDLRVQCVLDANDNCPGLSSNGSTGSNPPTVTLTPSATPIEALSSFSLNWTSSAGTEACYGSGPTNVTNWTGAVLPANGSRALSLAQGGYVFEIRCYNATGITTQTAVPVTVTQATTPPPPANYCDEVYPTKPTSANFTAFGFARQDTSFQQLWGVQAGQSSGTTTGVPGTYLNPSNGRYLAIPFSMTDDTGGSMSQFRLSWVEAQAIGIVTGQVTVTISPCPGDFRAKGTITNPDPYLSSACRADVGISGNMTVSATPSLSGCPAPKGKQMYINVATYNMYGASAPAQTTCNGQATCGVAMRLP